MKHSFILLMSSLILKNRLDIFICLCLMYVFMSRSYYFFFFSLKKILSGILGRKFKEVFFILQHNFIFTEYAVLYMGCHNLNCMLWKCFLEFLHKKNTSYTAVVFFIRRYIYLFLFFFIYFHILC